MRIIVVEDQALVARGLKLTLPRLGHEVCQVARTAAEAVAAVERHRPDLLTCDVDLGRGGSGVDVAREAHRRWGIRTLFIAARVDADLLAATRPLSPLGHIAKNHPGEGLTGEGFDAALAGLLAQVG